ncbi:MAG: PAS domain-containing protein [Pseudomonadota bacterium]|nr:PAS domain-containing protein [Pseudomonadota bacterium]
MAAWEWDVATGQMTLSDGAEEVFGTQWNAVDDAWPLTHPDDLERVRAIVDGALKVGGGFGYVNRIMRPDNGEIRWVETRAQVIRHSDERALSVRGVTVDVTERQLAQRAIEESAGQFRTLAQTLPNQVWTSRPDGNLDWFNERVYEYSGLEARELEGDRWVGIVHPDDRAATGQKWAEALASGRAYEAEFRVKRHDGEYRWHLARAMPILSASGKITRWIGTNTDIHHRKLAEAQSARDRERIWTLSQELMLVCDFAGLISTVNPSATRLLGWSEEEMIGRAITEFIHPDDIANSAAEMSKLAHGFKTLAFVNRYRTKDGGYRIFNWTAVPEGGLIHAVARDITGERAMAEERERIWNSTNDLLGTLSREGYLKSVNPAWQRLLGYSDQELLARPFVELVAMEDRSNLYAVMEQLRAGKSVRNLEDRITHKDGHQSLIAWSATPADEVFYIVGRDVSEQRAAEEALRQSQKMEAVGQLTGGIAHDFNNLLQGIAGSLDLIQKRILQGRIGELDRFVSSAMTSANRAAALTHRLLAFSRRQPLDPRPIQSNPLIISMEEMLRRTLGERVDLELVLAGGLWLTRCDPNQLESAILNLAINARDAMPTGGKLTIETFNAHLDSAYAAKQSDVRPGQYVCICVTDTGTGMSADIIARAFEPFFTTKPIGQGTGLGLSMIYGFARQSEGYTQIYSEVGKGTTVKLYLPRYRGEADEEEAIPDLTDAHNSEKKEIVLVVEDEPVVRGLIVEVLNDLGYRALEASDGPAGLAFLQSKQPIDLLVTDIGLPGLNGRQIADAARQLRPNFKVLFLTGYAENAALASGFLEPGMSMMTKPFAMEALATRIREILDDQP